MLSSLLQCVRHFFFLNMCSFIFLTFTLSLQNPHTQSLKKFLPQNAKPCTSYELQVNIEVLLIGQICIIIMGFIRLLLIFYSYLNVAFVPFDSNLSTLNQNKLNHENSLPNYIEYLLYWVLLAVLAIESPIDINLAFIFHLFSGSSVKPEFSIQRSSDLYLSPPASVLTSTFVLLLLIHPLISFV